ncbi:repair protein Rad1/Rec1/Rad17-domain-containing protein [Entophlyctis helioformis]|nr:repair protein Rad1/Rec1/Rad17-domain-containing protein [Entophlyctis helioformis]
MQDGQQHHQLLEQQSLLDPPSLDAGAGRHPHRAALGQFRERRGQYSQQRNDQLHDRLGTAFDDHAAQTVGSTGQTYRFESGTQPLEFVASLRSVAPLVTLLRAISFKQQKACCTIASEGLRLTAEDSQTVQAKAYLPKALFREFKWSDGTLLTDDRELSFMVDIRVLTDCLTIFGAQQQPGSGISSGQGAGTAGSGGGGIDEQTAPHAAPQTSPVSLQLSIPQGGGELTLMLQESNVVTACNLATYDIETLADLHLNFEEHPVVGKIIMKSDWLKTAFEELDATASDLQLTIAPQHPFMCISATGLAGESTLEYPRDTQVLESFHCSELSTNKYKFSMLQPCMRALAMSNKTSVRVNAKGILSLQFMIQLTTTHFSFVDYIVRAQHCMHVNGSLLRASTFVIHPTNSAARRHAHPLPPSH